MVASLGVRRNWDLDNVTAPIVTAAGDMVTLPALFLATYLVGHPVAHDRSWRCCVRSSALVALVASLRSRYPILRRIARESLPVLVLAGTIDVIAGLTIEKRFESFLVYPALLVLVPPFLEDSGALGSILSARVSTKLHLGTLVPGRGQPALDRRGLPPRLPLRDPRVLPARGVGRHRRAGRRAQEPGQPRDDRGVDAGGRDRDDVRGARRLLRRGRRRTASGLDPDNHGIPIVTSSLDLLGAFALILVIVALGLHPSPRRTRVQSSAEVLAEEREQPRPRVGCRRLVVVLRAVAHEAVLGAGYTTTASPCVRLTASMSAIGM